MPAVVRPAARLVPTPSTSAASCPDRGSRRSIGGRRRCGGAGYAGSLRLRNHARHGTDHDSKPLPPPSGIRLPSYPLRPRPEKRRSARAAAGRIGGGLLRVPRPAPGYDHLPERRFEFIPFWGILVFFLY